MSGFENSVAGFGELFGDFLDIVKVPNLITDEPFTWESSVIGEDNADLLSKCYEQLPKDKQLRIQAALKVLKSSSGDNTRDHMNKMMNSYAWSNTDPESTMSNVVDYVSRSFPAMRYPHNTNYYDVHVYFDDDQVEQARACKQSLANMGIRCFDLCRGPVGPHPKRMFECHAYNPLQYYKVANFLSKQSLCVLIHPNDGFSGEQQHFEQARWLNGKLPLINLWRRRS